MSSPQFVFKFPNFIRQFSSGTIYTLSPLSSLRLPYTRRSFRAETLLQPVPNHVVVFQRKSTVKKKKKEKNQLEFYSETRSTLTGDLPPPRFLSFHPLFLITVSRHRDAVRPE